MSNQKGDGSSAKPTSPDYFGFYCSRCHIWLANNGVLVWYPAREIALAHLRQIEQLSTNTNCHQWEVREFEK